jgi:phosphoribosyl-ATP pyrophosphohydrolase/phosphoribosyl-AMP cyclohydrolase/histidinol dehydrogenase
MSDFVGLRIVTPADVKALARPAVDAETLTAAARIVSDVRTGGEAALRGYAERFDALAPDAPLLLDRAALKAAWDALPADQQALLERTRDRIEFFAEAQRGALVDLTVEIEGGRAGHTVSPVERAGCYAPGGRFPLPSSVLMTAVTARVAGVSHVIVASPRPAPVTLAAAYIAGADALLPCGGAQAIAALAHGAGPVPACDVIVGPGNRWVTAAKQLVAGSVGIDMLAGPSELVVLATADANADPETIAADLLGQAEHDPDALPILVTTDAALPARVNAALARQLDTLPTADTARPAVAQGFAVVCADVDAAIAVCDALAPEHLEVLMPDAERHLRRFKHYGGLFLGHGAAEVLGDYGAGPNHVLPTGGTARVTGGLSVFTFLRVRTWLAMDTPAPLARDAAALARLEGLEAHARSAEKRLPE